MSNYNLRLARLIDSDSRFVDLGYLEVTIQKFILECQKISPRCQDAEESK